VERQVYQENKEFFKELINEPCSRHSPKIDKDVIMKAVYGREKSTKRKKEATIFTNQQSQSTQAHSKRAHPFLSIFDTSSDTDHDNNYLDEVPSL